MKWLTLQDDELPDGVHTTLVMILALCLAIPWWWVGLPAMLQGLLPPVMGPDFGTWLFGSKALTGTAARIGGACLTVLGLAIVGWGVRWTRWGEFKRGIRWSAWALSGVALLLYRWAMSAR